MKRLKIKDEGLIITPAGWEELFEAEISGEGKGEVAALLKARILIG